MKTKLYATKSAFRYKREILIEIWTIRSKYYDLHGMVGWDTQKRGEGIDDEKERKKRTLI